MVEQHSKPAFKVRHFYARKKGSRLAARTAPAARPATAKRDDDDDDETDPEWFSNFMGLAFDGRFTLYAAEGNSGRVRQVNVRTGKRTDLFELDRDDWRDSYTSDLALDTDRDILYVLDQANFRMAAIDVTKRTILSSVKLGRLPFAMSLSPDRRRAYVTNLGLFEYKTIPGADKRRARETGISFPAFGFPSIEAREGNRRYTAKGVVAIPGLEIRMRRKPCRWRWWTSPIRPR